ncbi:hypothetical protein GCM10022419_008230 [Nonomuraea rosea]|uniref:Uncharacterized protein n=1 Tax=Nonomuraea rosea TaxID=638574 RepID=A0ABP6VAP8_9ACTN
MSEDYPRTPKPPHPADCTVLFCEADHRHVQATDRLHWQAVADIDPGPSTIEVCYASDQPDGTRPFVQVRFGLDYLGPLEALDIPFPAAAALADLLQLLDGGTLPQLVHALRHTLEGPHQRRRRTRW